MVRASARDVLLLWWLPLLLLGGCPLPGTGVVTVELINDTDYEVDPWIVFDDDTGWAAQVYPESLLDTGLLLPGEVVAYDFYCDDLGVILSDEADQFVDDLIYRDWGTPPLVRGEDFQCGDLIQFQFLGNADTFGVVVAINGWVLE